jgi:hypothetical protein
MEDYNIFKSFTDSLLVSIISIENDYVYNRYKKKRKINKISYMIDDKDLIVDSDDEYDDCNRHNKKMYFITNIM